MHFLPNSFNVWATVENAGIFHSLLANQMIARVKAGSLYYQRT
jgi:hypothetical protein